MGGPTDASSTSARVFRVTVRSRFRDLSDETRRYLARTQPEHDIFVSAYTAEGTFTYDERIHFFNLRYEVRIDPVAHPDEPDPAALAATTAEVEAEQFLRTMGFGHHPLKVDVVDASAIWSSLPPDRR